MKTCSLLLTIAFTANLSGQGTILAVSSGGLVYRIDAGSGAPTILGHAGSNLNSLARHPQTGVFYTVSGAPTSTSAAVLLTIDPLTGVASNPGVPLTVNDVRGLAITPAGTCYAIVNGVPDLLYAIDLASGSTTLVGPTGSNSLEALASDASGLLWGWAVNPIGTAGIGTLMTVNPATGATATIGIGAAIIKALAFSPLGVLYGCNTNLFTIITTTGAAVPAGMGGLNDIRGIEFIEAPSVRFAPTNHVSPGGALTVHYWAPGHAGELFVPLPSCTLGSFSAPVLPQPLGISWDACTDFYFNNPLGVIWMPLTGSPPPGAILGQLDAAGMATGFVLPPPTLPPGLNLPVHVTFVSWTSSYVVTVHSVGTFILN